VFKRLFDDLGLEEDGRSSPTLNRILNCGSDPSLNLFIKKTKVKTTAFTCELATTTCQSKPTSTGQLKGKIGRERGRRFVQVSPA